MPGHRILAEIELLPPSEGGLRARVYSGARSLIFVFPSFEPGQAVINFGGQVQEIEGSSEPRETFRCQIVFWIDLAAVYATVGAAFDVWHGVVVGQGIVLDVVPPW